MPLQCFQCFDYFQHYAARNGHLNICQILIDHSASPNVQTKSGKVTPLHRAAYCGHTEIVKLLVKHGGDTTIQDADGKLPLHKVKDGNEYDICNCVTPFTCNTR